MKAKRQSKQYRESFDLVFRGGDVEAGQLPGANAQICIKGRTVDQDGHILISCQCEGPGDLELEVKRLKKELDALFNRGCDKFGQYNTRTKTAIRKKFGKC